jgi:hypothetical protein
MPRTFLPGLLMAALVAWPGVRAAEEAPTASATFASDTFIAGGSVRIDKPVPGDLIAAGGNADIDAPVAGAAMLAGGNLRVTAQVDHDIFAAGGRVILDAPIGRNLRAAGGQLDLGPMATVSGNATLAGGRVLLRGAIKGSLRVAGGQVTIDAPVGGDVLATTGELTLGPNARIGGKLRYYSGNEIKRDPAAQVGSVERGPLPGRGASAPLHREGGWGARAGARTVGLGWLWTLGLMAIAALLVGSMPVTSKRVAHALRMRPGASLGWGFVALVCIPVAALILMVTIVGIPLALLALLLYGLLLLVGYVASAVGLGQWALLRFKAEAAERNGWRIASAMAAVLVLALLGSVPFVGGFIALLAILAGIGAIVLLLAPRKPATPPAQASSV